MAITGTQKAYRPARAGLLRSGSGRSGWPVVVGVKVARYALSNIARSNATRSNYHAPTGFVALGGVHLATAPALPTEKIVGDLTITDILNEEPNRATFSVRGIIPRVGQDVVITLGSKNTLERLFAGQVLHVVQRYLSVPKNYVHDVSVIDWTWGLTQRLITDRWVATSATAIAQAIIEAGAPGFSSQYIEANLPTLDEFTVTNADAPSALTQLAKRLGGYWYVDYHKRVHLFTDVDPYQATPPQPINVVHRTLSDLTVDRDGSQLVTRVFVEGGGSTAMTEIAPGETLLPVATTLWYEAGGGMVTAGPQRMLYTGLHAGGGGGLVGPGAAPTTTPAAAAVGGSGIESGPHEYAVSFVTASGESLVSPRVPVVVGMVSPPPGGHVIGTLQPGPGPEPGAHFWAVTFVTATGETVLGPAVSAVSPEGFVPLASLTPGAPIYGGNLARAYYAYCVTFRTVSGETTPGPPSTDVYMVSRPVVETPDATPVPGTPSFGTPGIELDAAAKYAWGMTFVNAAGESIPGQVGPSTPVKMVQAVVAAPTSTPTPAAVTGTMLPPGVYQYLVTYVTTNSIFAGQKGDTGYSSPSQPGITGPVTLSGSTCTGYLTNVPISPNPKVIARRLYRKRVSSPNEAIYPPYDFRFAGDLNDNTTTQALDQVSDNSIGGPPPSNTTWEWTNAVPLTGIAVGPTGTTARKLYRRNDPSAALKFVATINDNTTTTYLDAKPTSSLGAGPPTSVADDWTNAVPLTQIPRGPTGTTARRIYRRTNGGAFGLIAEIGENTSTTYPDVGGTQGVAPPTVNTSGARSTNLLKIPTGGADVTARKLYRTRANTSGPYGLVLTMADNTTTTALDTVTDAGLGPEPPAATTATANRVQLSAIPIGPAAVTGRRIYRTQANASTLLLVTLLGDNATTSYLDAASDAALGAAAPGTDTSGLQQPAGNVPPGATSLIVAGTGAFRSAGGWAVIGNGQQVIRYSGVTGNSLTGIPPSGPGSITAAIAYNSTVTAAPLLLGIPASGLGAIRHRLARGEDVNLWIQVDDPTAQAAVALLLSGSVAGSHSGIIEDVLQDRRLSATECRARGKAHLAQRTDLQVRVRYKSRDLNTRSGRLVTVNLLGAPYFLSATFMIQSVTVRSFHPNLHPTFEVEASSVRFSFEDLLRRVRDRGTETLPTGG